jgi:hypothetical protein
LLLIVCVTGILLHKVISNEGGIERELFRNVLFLLRMASVFKVQSIRDSFHPRDADLVPHADVVYEDRNGKFLGKRHIAEKPEDQAKV